MELYVKQELMNALPQIDALLLDIDGVVLNVADTFRVVTSEIVQLFAKRWMNLEDLGEEGSVILLPEECELFKNAGGFNNDWDLTNAAVTLALGQQLMDSNIKTTAELRAKCDWVGYTTELKRRGGGLEVAEKYVLDLLPPPARRDFARAWNPRLVAQLFQETYAGTAMCHKLYGFEAEYVKSEGYLDKEPVIIDADLIPAKLKVGVLTGRTAQEAEIAIQRAGLSARIPQSHRVTDTDGVRKPDGATLELLQQKMGFKTALYVGDILDDLNTVKNFRALPASGRARVFSCLVQDAAQGNVDRRALLEAGTEFIAPDVNAVLQLLENMKK
ncbi:MAG TPA: HAD family hydrolase [Abditibacteriaceae bacterium]|jgi:HAD superfamily hydrolase (TIGR01548 family)